MFFLQTRKKYGACGIHPIQRHWVPAVTLQKIRRSVGVKARRLKICNHCHHRTTFNLCSPFKLKTRHKLNLLPAQPVPQREPQVARIPSFRGSDPEIIPGKIHLPQEGVFGQGFGEVLADVGPHAVAGQRQGL